MSLSTSWGSRPPTPLVAFSFTKGSTAWTCSLILGFFDVNLSEHHWIQAFTFVKMIVALIQMSFANGDWPVAWASFTWLPHTLISLLPLSNLVTFCPIQQTLIFELLNVFLNISRDPLDKACCFLATPLSIFLVSVMPIGATALIHVALSVAFASFSVTLWLEGNPINQLW